MDAQPPATWMKSSLRPEASSSNNTAEDVDASSATTAAASRNPSRHFLLLPPSYSPPTFLFLSVTHDHRGYGRPGGERERDEWQPSRSRRGRVGRMDGEFKEKMVSQTHQQNKRNELQRKCFLMWIRIVVAMAAAAMVAAEMVMVAGTLWSFLPKAPNSRLQLLPNNGMCFGISGFGWEPRLLVFWPSEGGDGGSGGSSGAGDCR